MREVSSILTRGDPGSSIEIVWQTDGRPMSGDVGRGMAHAAVSFAKRALDVKEANSLPGYVQLAGSPPFFPSAGISSALHPTSLFTLVSAAFICSFYLFRSCTRSQLLASASPFHPVRNRGDKRLYGRASIARRSLPCPEQSRRTRRRGGCIRRLCQKGALHSPPYSCLWPEIDSFFISCPCRLSLTGICRVITRVALRCRPCKRFWTTSQSGVAALKSIQISLEAHVTLQQASFRASRRPRLRLGHSSLGGGPRVEPHLTLYKGEKGCFRERSRLESDPLSIIRVLRNCLCSSADQRRRWTTVTCRCKDTD